MDAVLDSSNYFIGYELFKKKDVIYVLPIFGKEAFELNYILIEIKIVQIFIYCYETISNDSLVAEVEE